MYDAALERPVPLRFDLFCAAVRDGRDLLMRHLETVDIFDGRCNVTLAHATGIHRQHLALDGRDIALVLLDDLRLKRALAVSGDTDRDFAQRCLEPLG